MHALTSRRPRRNPSRLPRLLVVLAFLALTSPPSLFAAEVPRWSLRGYGAFFSPTGDEVTVVSAPGGVEERRTHSAAEDGSGLGIAFEYRLGGRLGIEVGATFLDFDNDFRFETGGVTVTDRDSLALEMYHLALFWHFTPERRADFRAGLFVAETSTDVLTFLDEIGRPVDLTFDDDYGFGAAFGVDVDITRSGRWFLSAEARQLVTILESDSGGRDLDLDPLLVMVGVGWRF